MVGSLLDTFAPFVFVEGWMQRIRKGDLVEVIHGADRGKQGRVLSLDSQTRRIRVEKIRIQKRHLKPGRSGAEQGGIVEDEGYIALSNVMLVHPSDNKPSRVRIEEKDGQRIRVFARGGDPVRDPSAG